MKLSDTQRILLSTASQRGDGSILPLPGTVSPGGGAAKAVVALLKRGLAEERAVRGQDVAALSDVDARVGVFITPAGAAAIGIEPSEASPASDAAEVPSEAAQPAVSAVKPRSKATVVLALLSRPAGATLPELIEVTGWLPHTTRAALTGIRKKGHEVARSKRDGATCYAIVGEA